MALPRAIATTGGGLVLAVVDYQVLALQAKADANGNALVAYDQIDPLQLWRVERLVVQLTSTVQVNVTVYGGSSTPQRIDARDWTPVPAGFVGVAEYPQPMTIPGGSFLSVQATGCTPGDTMTVSAQWALVQRVPAGS